MKNNITFLLFMLFTIFCNAQSQMTVKEDYWSGSAIYLNGNKISINDAKDFAKNNLEVIKKFSSAQTNRTIGGILGYPGAFAFGYTLGSSFNKTVKANWTVGGIGAAMMISGMILQSKGNNQMKEAVSDYNKSISKDTSLLNPEFYISSSEDGIGIAIKF